MLLSFLQVMDFCMFWFIIIDSFISTIRWTGPPMGFCEELMETREPKSKRILKPQRLYLHFGKSFLWPLLSRMFQVHSDTQIYGDTWLKIYTILKV
ncbi:hypothetical protein SNEBB_010600 [Seison nebaliae]|nr:hypothetical protein SNEBB_010600 [Seison nebaliae]